MGVFKPWENGFYLTLLCYYIVHDKTIEKKHMWFYHKCTEGRNGDVIRAQLDEFQHDLNSCDLAVAHHLKHDMNILRYIGIDFENVNLWCTQVVEYLLEGQTDKLTYSLKACCDRRKIHQKGDLIQEYEKQKIDTYNIPADRLLEYCYDDIECTWQLYQKQDGDVYFDNKIKIVELQNEFIRCLSDMELNGIKWDNERAKKIHADLIKQYKEMEHELKEIFGERRLNINSGEQLSAALYGGTAKVADTEWVIKTYKTKPYSTYREKTITVQVEFQPIFKPLPKTELEKEGYYQTNKDTIQKLKCKNKKQRRVRELLLELSVVKKAATSLLGTSGKTGLITQVQSDGYVHTQYNQTITKNGRLSSSNPNSQNLPRGNTSPIKLCVIPRNDFIGQVDLSQIEWRDAAFLSQDPVMIKEIREGVDQHIATCTKLMELPFVSKKDDESKRNRFNAKTFNFRMIYGGSEWGFHLDHKMPDFGIAKWKKVVRDFYAKYRGLKAWHDKNIYTVKSGGQIRLPTGRHFCFYKEKEKDGIKTYSETQIKNYPVSGLAGGDTLPLLAVIIRNGMKKYGLKSLMILTVHDSIVFDIVKEELPALSTLCLKACEQLPTYIENYYGFTFNVPLEGEFEIGKNYGELEEYSHKK